MHGALCPLEDMSCTPPPFEFKGELGPQLCIIKKDLLACRCHAFPYHKVMWNDGFCESMPQHQYGCALQPLTPYHSIRMSAAHPIPQHQYECTLQPLIMINAHSSCSTYECTVQPHIPKHYVCEYTVM